MKVLKLIDTVCLKTDLYNNHLFCMIMWIMWVIRCISFDLIKAFHFYLSGSVGMDWGRVKRGEIRALQMDLKLFKNCGYVYKYMMWNYFEELQAGSR